MNRVNKFLVLFVVLLSGVIWSTWQFMQSELFASYAAKRLTSYISNQTNLTVKFERIEFQLYPIGSVLKSVEILSQNETDLKNVYASEVGFYFDFLDFFSNKITIESVRVVSAEVSFSEKLFDSGSKNKNKKDFIEEVKTELKKINHQMITNLVRSNLPIELESLEFVDSIIRFGSNKYDLSHASVSIFNKLTEVKAKVEDLSLRKLGVPLISEVDSVEIDLQINNDDFRIKKIEIMQELSKLMVSGKVENSDELPLELKVEFESGLGRIVELTQAEEWFQKSSGLIYLEGTISNNVEKPKGEFKLLGQNIRSDYFNIKNLKTDFLADSEKIQVQKMKISHRSGDIDLLRPVDLLSSKTGEILLKQVPLNLDKFHTNDALWFLRDSLDVLKGELSGKLKINFKGSDVEFVPQKGFALEKLELVDSDNPLEKILVNNGISFQRGKMTLKNGEDFELDIDVRMNKTNFIAKGLIRPERLDLEVKEGFIDLEEFGPISGTMLKGSGRLTSKIYGTYENVIFDFFPDLSDFSVVDLNLGRVRGHVSLHLRELDLFLRDIKANYKSTEYTGQGWLNFDKKNGLDLDINIHKGFYTDTLEILSDLVSDLDFTLPKAALEYTADVKVSGTFDKDKLVVEGALKGKELNFFLEDFNSISTSFRYFSTGFDIENIILTKETGQIKGAFSMNLENDYIEYDATASGFMLSDFRIFRALKLGVESELFGEFYGTGTPNDFSSRTHIKSLSAKIGEKKVGDSFFTIYNNGPDLFLTINLLNGEGNLESFIYLDKDKKKSSYVKALLNSMDVRNLLGILSVHNVDNPDVSGELQLQLHSQFDIYDPYKLNADLKVDSMTFSKGKNEYQIKRGRDSISIKRGKIKSFDIGIFGNDESYVLKGVGDLSNSFSVSQDFVIGAHFAELISEKVRGSSGKITAKAKLLGKNKNLENFMELEGEGISLNYIDIPGPFVDTSFKVLIENNNILIQEAQTNYGNGLLKAEGAIETLLPYPRLDIYWEIDNSRFPVFSRSSVVMSGKGKLSGFKLPYKLYGDVSVFHGEVIDSLDEFQSEVGVSTEYQKFIPKNIGGGKFHLIDLDLGVNIVRPIRVFNSLTELHFDGGIRLFGEPKSPNVVGQLSTISGKSKFKFKGYEFDLIEGKVLFPKGRSRMRPDIKFAGVTDINNYNVKVDVIGPANEVAIGLSSTPPLSQEDIKSLLAIGVTTDVSRGLDDGQRQSMTTIGVGSMIFEQFKINQELNSSLGLRLSVLPEIAEDETSLLQGKSGVSDTSSTRVKSSTKIKVQKKLTDKVDLSVSSTVGGSIEQRQEMNINFQINNKVSVEGVYEVRSNEENEAETPDSIGVDLKWKTSF